MGKLVQRKVVTMPLLCPAMAQTTEDIFLCINALSNYPPYMNKYKLILPSQNGNTQHENVYFLPAPPLLSFPLPA